MKNVNDITGNTMPRILLFLDSSALIAGIISDQGAARALLLLSEQDKLNVTVSEQVITETERNLARKAPRTLPFAREFILRAHIRIVQDPQAVDVHQHMDWIRHTSDVPILLAAMLVKADFLVTLNTRHFVDDPKVAQRSGLLIGTPGDALTWVRPQLAARPD